MVNCGVIVVWIVRNVGLVVCSGVEIIKFEDFVGKKFGMLSIGGMFDIFFC